MVVDTCSGSILNVDAGRLQTQGQLKLYSKTLSRLKQTAWLNIPQLVKSLSIKQEALGSIPSAAKTRCDGALHLGDQELKVTVGCVVTLKAASSHTPDLVLKITGWVWWCTLLIPVLGRQR